MFVGQNMKVKKLINDLHVLVVFTSHIVTQVKKLNPQPNSIDKVKKLILEKSDT